MPEIVYLKDYPLNGTNQSCYVLVAFSASRYYNSSKSDVAGYSYHMLAMPAASIDLCNLVQISYVGNSSVREYSPYVHSMVRFSRKTSSELFYVQGFNSSNINYSSAIKTRSRVTGIYDSQNSIDVDTYTVYQDPILVSPIASEEFYIYRAYILDGEVYLRAGSISPFTNYANNDYTENTQKLKGIALSPYAQLFPDSMEYLSSHNMFVIFVGTGICFSHTPLDMNSWGYFDTTEYFGIISQLGNAEYDVETNTLCLSGRDTEGNFVCGRLRLHERFDYSNDGAWLPYIASSGVPAWIKHTESGQRKISISVTVASNRVNYCGVILNGERLVGGQTYTRTISSDDETFTVGMEVLLKTAAVCTLYVNGSQLLQIQSGIEAGETNTAELRWDDYSGTMTLEIK